MYNSFPKKERLNSKLIIDDLFNAGNGTMTAYPLRAVWKEVENLEVPVSVLISVPKKRFHHAVDRNRMKRMVREAYRKNKHTLWDVLCERHIALALICITDEMPSSHKVEKAVTKLLVRIAEKTTQLTINN